MEWKSVLIGFIIGALIAVPYGLAHSGPFSWDEDRSFWGGFGPMMGVAHGPGMMDEDMYAEMEQYMESGDFAEMHEEMEEEMEPIMEKYMGSWWEERHEYCERVMGIEEESDGY
ncbi:hypothetical protein E3E23_09035 [Thermococcus sp. CX2]|uniref:hypothetical protein n=1 Tax=Thermococcus sp. CX2 TaxID=163006 RepID=UPI00143A0A1E|nr:hypothetical protein [Thermococcus sp. CX2]NJE85964.1 hypothetical protein [Thermococcus sp. CX2]